MLRLLFLLLAACAPSPDRQDSGPRDGGEIDGGEVPDGEMPDAGAISDCDEPVAGFEINSTPQYGGFQGLFADRPDPFLRSVKVLERGKCMLLTGDPDLICNPPCNSGYCTREGCVPRPQNVDIGTIRVRGTSPELDLNPTSGVYYTMTNYPGLIPAGGTARLEVDGNGYVDPFSLEVRNISPIDAPDSMVRIVEHEDAVLTWPVAGPADDIVQVQMDSDHHGAFGSVQCEAPNGDGMVVVDAELVDGLIEAGRSGIGTYVENSFMTRLFRQRTVTSRGCAQFFSVSRDWFYVETILAP